MQTLKRRLFQYRGTEKYYDLEQQVKKSKNERNKVQEKQWRILDKIEKLPKNFLMLHRPAGSREFDEKRVLGVLYGMLKINPNHYSFKKVISIKFCSPHFKVEVSEDLLTELKKIFEEKNENTKQLMEYINITHITETIEKASIISDENTVLFSDQLLIKSDIFVSRVDELKQFQDNFLVKPNAFILNIHTNGDGGVGKTQLLRKMMEQCRIENVENSITGNDLIDFYHTENRSKVGIIQHIVEKIGDKHFPSVEEQFETYHQTKDSSERQYIPERIVKCFFNDYNKFCARAEQNEKVVVLFFDTYEVIQIVDKGQNEAHYTDFSKWLETEFFPGLQANNARVVVAGRYPLQNIGTDSMHVERRVLSLFNFADAVAFLIESLRIVKFSQKDYNDFWGKFPKAADVLRPFLFSLENGQSCIYMYELTEEHRKNLGEEVWTILTERTEVKNQADLLSELSFSTEQELRDFFELCDDRPIFLALFIDWFNSYSVRDEPIELLEKIKQYDSDKEEQNI